MILTIRERAVFILLSKIENSSISSHFTNFQKNLSDSKCNSVFILLFKSQDQIHVNYNIENFTLIEQIPKKLSADFERIYSCFYVSSIMNGFHHHNLFNTLRIYTKNFKLKSTRNPNFWYRSSLAINSDICLPSISLNVLTLMVKLAHNESKCSQKLGQSSKK